jgi:hypothetical protein
MNIITKRHVDQSRQALQRANAVRARRAEAR